MQTHFFKASRFWKERVTCVSRRHSLDEHVPALGYYSIKSTKLQLTVTITI